MPQIPTLQPLLSTLYANSLVDQTIMGNSRIISFWGGIRIQRSLLHLRYKSNNTVNGDLANAMQRIAGQGLGQWWTDGRVGMAPGRQPGARGDTGWALQSSYCVTWLLRIATRRTWGGGGAQIQVLAPGRQRPTAHHWLGHALYPCEQQQPVGSWEVLRGVA